MYREFALPYEQRIFTAVKEKGAIPRLHICGNTTHLLQDMALSDAQIVDIDWMVDLSQAAEALGETIVCGNLDPVAVFLLGTPKQVRQAALALLPVATEPFIASLATNPKTATMFTQVGIFQLCQMDEFSS
jgi:uroporphyrinogen-III decarboxylase